MDKWPQREQFKARLDAYLAQAGMTQQEFADRIGTSLDNLRNCLYRPERRLGEKARQRSAVLFGCPASEFTDDPGADIPGTTHDSSEMDRVMLRAMGHDLGSLTEAQRLAAYQAWKAIVGGLKA